jgi:hypothetical protein
VNAEPFQASQWTSTVAASAAEENPRAIATAAAVAIPSALANLSTPIFDR